MDHVVLCTFTHPGPSYYHELMVVATWTDTMHGYLRTTQTIEFLCYFTRGFTHVWSLLTNLAHRWRPFHARVKDEVGAYDDHSAYSLGLSRVYSRDGLNFQRECLCIIIHLRFPRFTTYRDSMGRTPIEYLSGISRWAHSR